MTSPSLPTSSLTTANLTGRALESRAPRRVLRRVGTVLAGLATVIAVTTAVDFICHATGLYPAPGEDMSHALYALALAYRTLFGVAGGYVTARLAPDRPVAHAVALGILGCSIGLLGAIVMWGVGPLWYPLAVSAVAVPTSWAGGRLFARR